MNFLFITLIFSIFIGQIIRIPIGTHGAINLLDISVAFFCLIGLFKLRFKPKKPPIFVKTGLIFSLIALVSLIFTPLHLNPPEYLTSFFYTIRFGFYILLGWVIFSDAFLKLDQKIPQILIFSGIILACLGLLQFIFLPNLDFLASSGWDPHQYRVVSTFLDPNFIGAYFVLTLLLISSKKYLWPIPYFTLLLTFSRSSYLMFLISFLTLSFFQKSWKMAFISILLFLGLIIGFQIYSQAVAKPRGVSREQSASFRLNTWQQGLTLFQNHPILGVGFNTYRFALKQYNLVPEDVIESRGGSTNDSSLLFVASTTGMLGLLSYMAFLIAVFIRGLRTDKLLSCAILGLLAHSTFANSLFYPHILVWIILLASSNSKFPLEKGQKK